MTKVAVVYNVDTNEVVDVFSSYINALKWGLRYITSGKCGDLELSDFGIDIPFDQIDWTSEKLQKAVDFSMAEEYLSVTMHTVRDE